MKVVFLIHSYFRYIVGGTEYQAFLLAKELVKRNLEVHYIFINSTKVKVPIVYERIYLHPLKSLKKLRYWGNPYFLYKRPIIEILDKLKPDIIYDRNLSSFLGIACKYCQKHNCKVIWHIANRPDVQKRKIKFNKNIFINYIEKKYLEYGIKHADYIIGQAEYQDSMLSKNFGRKCDLIVKNYHPLHTEKINKIGKIKIVWIANFKNAKQPKIFVELAMKFKSYSNVIFIMVGRNSDYLKNAELPVNIDIKGTLEIEDVNKLLNTAHIFVNTSIYEGFPNTFIQAWMRKVSVVSLNVDPDDILQKNKIGFHSGSFDQLVKDVKILIEDGRLREEMGEKAQKYAFENHSLKNINEIVSLIKSNE